MQPPTVTQLVSKLPLIFLVLAARAGFGLQQLVIVAFISRFWPAELLGVFGFVLAIVTPAAGFFGIGLRQGVATDIVGNFPAQTYWLLRQLTLLAMAVVVPLGVWIWIGSGPHQVFFPMLLAMVFVKAVDLNAELYYGFLQRAGRMTRLSVSQLLRALAGIFAFGAAVAAGAPPGLAFVAWGAGWLLVMALHGRCARGGLRFGSLTTERIPGLLKVQWPFGFAAGMALISLAAPRLLLGMQPGAGALAGLGVFTALFMVFQAGQGFVLSVLHIWLSPLAAAFASGRSGAARRRIAQLFLCVAGAGICLPVFCMLTGSWLPVVLFGPDFSQSGAVFFMLSLGWAFLYPALVFRLALQAARHFRRNLWCEAITALLTFALCAAALAEYGSLYALAAGFALAQGLGMCVFGLAVFFGRPREINT